MLRKFNFQRILFATLGSIVFLAGCSQNQVSTSKGTSPNSEISDSRVTPLSEREYTNIVLDGQELQVEVADTPAKNELGLSYRSEIGADGMLFYLPSRMVATFWMKGMNFDLDMVWIDCQNEEPGGYLENDNPKHDDLIGAQVIIDEKECVVADVSRDVPAPSDPLNIPSLPVYSPAYPVTHVLELAS